MKGGYKTTLFFYFIDTNNDLWHILIRNFGEI